MKRIAAYRFCFEDGSEIVTAGMTCDLARELINVHGKITNKEFVEWREDFGGERNVSTND